MLGDLALQAVERARVQDASRGVLGEQAQEVEVRCLESRSVVPHAGHRDRSDDLVLGAERYTHRAPLLDALDDPPRAELQAPFPGVRARIVAAHESRRASNFRRDRGAAGVGVPRTESAPQLEGMGWVGGELPREAPHAVVPDQTE